MSSIARSARACISSSVRSWMGWATKTQAGLKPSAVDWAMAASRNGSEATNTVGTPRASRLVVSCTLHVVHDPQSASPSMTASHSENRKCGQTRQVIYRNTSGFADAKSLSQSVWGCHRSMNISARQITEYFCAAENRNGLPWCKMLPGFDI